MKKNCSYTSIEGEPKLVNELADVIDSSSTNSMNSDVLRKEENLNCQPFSVADVRNENPMACIPVNGFETDVVVEEVDKALNVFTDVIDSDDERENKKTRPMKELIWMENKVSAGKGIGTQTLQQTRERPSSSNGQEFFRAQGSRKAKRSCPFMPNINPVSTKHAKTTGFETDAVVEEGDKALNVFTDVIDSDDEREYKKTRPMKELLWVENKAPLGKGIGTQTLQQTGERPSSSNATSIGLDAPPVQQHLHNT
ncbi:hypothetical protein AgCh_023810 [Apium graveolens]